LYKIKKISIVGAVVMLLVGAVWGGSALHRFSYAKLTPLAIEIELDSQLAQQLFVEYDYGYGFIPEHRQVFSLSSARSQVVDLSISGWKKLRRMRVHVENSGSSKVHSVLVSNSENSNRMQGPWNERTDGQNILILSVEDIQALLNVE
jgi:hypothetical protein